MHRRSALRASDADRDRVGEVLRRAAGEGRIRTEELEQRMEAALRSRTYGELEATVSDLPHEGPRPRARRGKIVLARLLAFALAVPLVLALTAVIALAITGVFAGWLVWLGVVWFLFGRRGRRAFGAPRAGGLYGRGRRRRSYRGHARGFWA